MSEHPTLLRRLIAGLLAALQAKGYPLGPGKLMQVEELLQGLPPDTAPERLRSLLAPLFASSAEEQRAFYALFDRVRAGLEETPNPGPDIASGPQPAGKKKRRWYRYLAAVLLLCAAGYAAKYFFTPPPPPDPPTRERFALAQGDSILRSLRGEGDTAQLLRATDYGGLEIAELPLPFPRDLSELRVDPEALARAELIRRYQWPVKALLFLLGAFALWAFLRWYERRRARFVAEIEQRDRPPYVWQLETGEEGAPDFGEGLTLLLNRLRRRESADLQRLDLRATVRASVRNAGRAIFRFREQTRPPEYLLLIDRYDANDHSARWFDAFFRELVRAEIPVWRYFYQGDPRVCFDEAHPQGIALGELLHRHHDARLLLFGEGQRLLSPASGLLAPWTTLFAGWRRRALLLTKPGRDWGRREQTLSALFAVSPASVKGIDLALEQFETLAQRSPAEALRRTDDAFADPIVFEGSLLRTLERHFPPALLRWIAACAVYPALHWDLTLFLGSTLSEPGQAPLGSADNLRQLLRLPWFAQGRIPDNARLQLIEYLAAQGLETRVRKALDELLRRAPAPPPDSVAWDEHRMNVVLNELLLTTDKKRRRALEAEFERFLATGKQPDFVTFKQLLRKPTALDLVVPDRWKKHFFRHSTSRFGLRRPAWWGLGALLLGLGLTLAPVEPRVCSGETTTYQGQTLCLETPADELLYLEFLAYDAIEAQNHPLADSLRGRVGPISRKALPPADTLPFYRNTAVRSFNYAARTYNCSLRPTPGCPGRSADSLRQEACENFRRAAVLYAAVGEQRVEFAIALQQACPGESPASVPEGPVLRGQVLDARKRLEPTPTGDDIIVEALVNKMVRVRGGTFTMGCTPEQGSDCYDDEQPAHRVTVSDFSIGTYEVTQREWRAVMGSDPPELAFKGCDACPVERVSWDDIQSFLSKLNAKTGRAYRLPTEAEWEYAARGGSQSRGYKYAGSNRVDEVAWYGDNSGDKTHPVGQKKANELGLYDMSGNVWEWCADDWHSNYSGAPSTSRPWIDSPRASNRVNRGGGWGYGALRCRVSYRSNNAPSFRGLNLGFRLAL